MDYGNPTDPANPWIICFAFWEKYGAWIDILTKNKQLYADQPYFFHTMLV